MIKALIPIIVAVIIFLLFIGLVVAGIIKDSKRNQYIDKKMKEDKEKEKDKWEE